MKRQIKFRIWNNEDKKMIYQSPISSKYYGMTITGLCYDNGRLRDWTPLQWTGLKDKNGKEIYEGDIVCLLEGEFGYLFKGVVFYNEKIASFEIKCNETEIHGFYFDGEYEVEGNIYETT